MGPELMDRLRAQSIEHGTKILTETVVSVDLSSNPFKLITEDGAQFYSKSLIVATGATAKRLGIRGEKEYWQKGISACAVCDGALPIFRNTRKILNCNVKELLLLEEEILLVKKPYFYPNMHPMYIYLYVEMFFEHPKLCPKGC